MDIIQVYAFVLVRFIFLLPVHYLIIFKIKSVFLALFFGNILWITISGYFLVLFYGNDEYINFYFTLIAPLIAMSVTLSILKIVLNHIKMKKNQKESELISMEISDL